jgi:hypothetical protein
MKTVSADQLKQIADLANGVPPEYRAKCFELLLSHALGSLPTPDAGGGPKAPVPPSLPITAKPFVLPIDVKAFLSQYTLDEAILWKLFLVEGKEIRPIYHLKTTKKATVQIQYALLMALENALTTGEFKVEIEALRTRCTEQKSYDSVNFMTILKNNQNNFKSVNKDEPLVLSPEGKSGLADVIEELNTN